MSDDGRNREQVHVEHKIVDIVSLDQQLKLSRANEVGKKSGLTLSAHVEQPPLSSKHIGRVEVT